MATATAWKACTKGNTFERSRLKSKGPAGDRRALRVCSAADRNYNKSITLIQDLT